MQTRHTIIVAVLIALIIGGGIFLLLSTSGAAGPTAGPAGATPASSSSSPHAVSASPSPTITQATTNPLALTAPTDFSNRVLDFEEAYQNRAQPGGLARLAPFVTEQYLKDHTPPPDGKYALPTRNVVITVNRDLKQTIVVPTFSKTDPNVQYVSVTPAISSSRQEADGQRTPVDTDLPTHQVHATTWKLVDGIWRVDQDR